MARLKVSLKSDNKGAGNHSYFNEVNANNFKEIALVLSDLKSHSVPIDRAFKELKDSKRSPWDDVLGI